MKKNAFTIIELVVVMAILGLLAAAVVVGFGKQQAAGRDAKRKADLSTINTALQSYLADKGTMFDSVADSGGSWDVSSLPTSGPNATDFLSTLVSNSYLSKVPVDPINNGNTNFYDRANGGTGFAYGFKSPVTFGNNIIYSLVTVLEADKTNNGLYNVYQIIRPL